MGYFLASCPPGRPKWGRFNRFFRSVFTEEPAGEIPQLETKFGDTLTGCTFTEEDVAEQLRGLKPDKSPGLDGIHPRVLQTCAEELAVPLHIVFRKSLDEECLPEDWKLARVVPIYKRGARKSPGNYRPVSLTSIPCKVFESIDYPFSERGYFNMWTVTACLPGNNMVLWRVDHV